MAGRALVREYNALVAERILDVAARLFVEHGVAAVGIAGVAKAAEQFVVPVVLAPRDTRRRER